LRDLNIFIVLVVLTDRQAVLKSWVRTLLDTGSRLDTC